MARSSRSWSYGRIMATARVPRAARTSRCASSQLVAMGFSRTTCLPASSAAAACSACSLCGVLMMTASTRGLPSNRSMSLVQSTELPRRSAATRAVEGRLVQTATMPASVRCSSAGMWRRHAICPHPSSPIPIRCTALRPCPGADAPSPGANGARERHAWRSPPARSSERWRQRRRVWIVLSVRLGTGSGAGPTNPGVHVKFGARRRCLEARCRQRRAARNSVRTPRDRVPGLKRAPPGPRARRS